MITKNEVLLWKKYALTLSEAAQYFGIGERKLQQIADDIRFESVMTKGHQYDIIILLVPFLYERVVYI